MSSVGESGGSVVVLTGAGISTASGIPDFRGPEGFWTVGSRQYHPQELATFAAFSQMPAAVWSWYLYRRSVCLAAAPNQAHLALAELERQLGERFTLVTQNVDGLHLRAGNSLSRTWQIHGNIQFVRCSAECNPEIAPVPDEVPDDWRKGRELDADLAGVLRCGRCRAWLRPHVLWFDECYDEPRYRFDSSMDAARCAAMLVVVGTSGTTTLPTHMVRTAFQASIPLLVVDPEPGPFGALADASPVGAHLAGTAVEIVPEIVALLDGQPRR